MASLGRPIDTSPVDQAVDAAAWQIRAGLWREAGRTMSKILKIPVFIHVREKTDNLGVYWPDLEEIDINIPEEFFTQDISLWKRGRNVDNVDYVIAVIRSVLSHEYLHFIQNQKSSRKVSYVHGSDALQTEKGTKKYLADPTELNAWATQIARQLRDRGIRGLAYPPDEAAVNSAYLSTYVLTFNPDNPSDAKVLRRLVREVNLRMALNIA